MSARVTALIGAYNNATTLERAAGSILEQTVAELELLIIDDGSIDRTGEIAARVAAQDGRVRVLTMPSNVGISRSLNSGLEAASAPYVAVLDADDWSDPRRLERQLEVLESDSSIAVVGCRMREVDESGRELVPRTSLASGEVNRVLMRFNPIPNTAAAFRRDPVMAVGGYDPRYLWAAEYDLWLRLAEHHRIFALDEVLATRQMSSSNVAARREREQIAETIVMRGRAMIRQRSVQGITGLAAPALSYATPLPLKRARRRRLSQAP
ncbi:MAG: glycosyltransferase [Actinomycetota bacterium]|nr:glycosyltransferase [Actinomycetota bacterium]